MLSSQEIKELMENSFQKQDIRMMFEEESTQQQEHPAVTAFASRAHEDWRKDFDPEGSGKERPKKNSDGTEGNINVPFNKLHPDWQKENLEAGRAAKEACEKYPDDDEKAAEHIHKKWMERNPRKDWNAEQHVPFNQLTKKEADKDRLHVSIMRGLLRAKP